MPQQVVAEADQRSRDTIGKAGKAGRCLCVWTDGKLVGLGSKSVGVVG